MLLANPPISQGLIRENLTIPTRNEFAKEKADTALKRLSNGIESDQCPLADGLAGFDGGINDRAQLFDRTSVRESVLLLKRRDDPKRELMIVQNKRL